MTIRVGRWALVAVLAAAVAVGLVLLGRVTTNTNAAHDRGYRAGHDDGYFAGLRAGQAEGRRLGRVLQEGSELPPDSRKPVQDAFDAGYVAGADDAFAGYDGGWTFNVPYVVTLVPGTNQIVYAIDTRELVQPGVDYRLCADGHTLCQSKHK
jgi:hypothetical protein